MPAPAAIAPPSALPDQREARHLRVGRALFDRVESALAASRLSARGALLAAAALGQLRAVLSGRWPSARDVAALYGSGRFESRRVAFAIAVHEARNRLVVRRVSGQSLAPFAPLVRFRDARAAAALRPPLVLVTAHIGALYLLDLGLEQVAGPRTVLRWSAVHEPFPEEEIAATAGGLEARTEALRRGLGALRTGKFVVTTLDGPHGAGRPGTLLGRSLAVGRGGFALARASGARVAPLAALWEGGRVVVELGAAVAMGTDSQDGPQQVVRWFERLLRRSPGQISLGLLRQLLLGSAVDPTIQAPDEDAMRR